MNQLNPFLTGFASSPIFLVLLVWALFWKGVGLWVAAKRDAGWWFVAILLINLFGILEIIYIFYFAKMKWGDVKNIFAKKTSSSVQ